METRDLSRHFGDVVAADKVTMTVEAGATFDLLGPNGAGTITVIKVRAGAAVPAAYVAGVIGCLLGADIFNLGRIRELCAPLASIGGSGTFDAIFLTGITAVLIASF